MSTDNTKKKNKKQNIIILIALCLIIIVVAVILIVGTTSKHITRTLQEQTEENIKLDNKKINVYFFYGNGCPHCEELIKFLDNLPEKYDNYFDLYTMEVWYNKKNSKLMEDLVGKLGKKVEGLPCLIVGDQVFFGYSEAIGKKIKKAIKEEYLVVDKYDVYKNYK